MIARQTLSLLANDWTALLSWRGHECAEILSSKELTVMDAYWRAANYLTVGQIYLLDNPLLREPLEPEHIKPRLLGHWGTSPGSDLLYVHLNRLDYATTTPT